MKNGMFGSMFFRVDDFDRLAPVSGDVNKVCIWNQAPNPLNVHSRERFLISVQGTVVSSFGSLENAMVVLPFEEEVLLFRDFINKEFYFLGFKAVYRTGPAYRRSLVIKYVGIDPSTSNGLDFITEFILTDGPIGEQQFVINPGGNGVSQTGNFTFWAEEISKFLNKRIEVQSSTIKTVISEDPYVQEI